MKTLFKTGPVITINKNIFLACMLLFLCLSFTSCYKKSFFENREDGLSAFSADSLRQHISVLSSDMFEGRKPFTSGETKTINYLKQQFAIAGLEPGNGNSYLQEVPMANILAVAAPEMKVESEKGDFTLKAYDDYVIWTNKTQANINLDNTELIFAGYGVVAPEYNWNDYEGLDVKDKVVMVMVNDPGFWAGDTSLFKGKAMTYYGRWTYKFEEAARQGAKGCLIIHNTSAASYPFIVLQNSFNCSRLQLDKRGQEDNNCDVIGWVTEDVANKLFSASGFDSSLFSKANKSDFRAVPLNVRLSTSMKVSVGYNKSYNVIGKITGSKYPDEVIIYTAHWDHLGIGTPDEAGDSIYNGASDNASAVAGLLELARAFKSMKNKPERTIVFLSVTSEEQGLLGSAYYVQNPVFPLNKTLADINMECLNSGTATKDMVIIGKGQSRLEDYFYEEVQKEGCHISPEAHPEAGSYFRSDHLSFSKAGIPSLYTQSGTEVEGKEKGYGEKILNDYYAKYYHRPSDEYDPLTWTMEGALLELRLLFQTGKRISSEEKRPASKKGAGQVPASPVKKFKQSLRHTNEVEPEYLTINEAIAALKVPEAVAPYTSMGPSAELPAPFSPPYKSIEPVKLFDNMYFVGTTAVGAFIIDSGDGLIMFDTGCCDTDAALMAEDIKKLGLDPSEIKLILLSHEHFDHYGGVVYLKKIICPNAKVAMSLTSWNFLQSVPNEWPYGGTRPQSVDIFLTDGMKIRHGNAKIQVVATPGHSAGCVSFIVPVTDNGDAHVVGIMGGSAIWPTQLEANLYKSSIEYFKAFAMKAGCDIGLGFHSQESDFTGLRNRKAGEPNPLVLGKEQFNTVYLRRFRNNYQKLLESGNIKSN